MGYSRRIPARVTGVHEVLRHELIFSYSPASSYGGPCSIPDQLYVEFLVDKVAVVLREFQFSRVIIIPSLPRAH